MVRGMLVLAAFAAVLGGLVYWGPLKLSVTWQHPQSTNPPQSTTNRTQAASLTPLARKSAESAAASSREPVLAATAAAPASAIAVLPEKAIRGFPAVPQTTATDEQSAATIRQAHLLRERESLVAARDALSDFYLGHRLSNEQRLRIAEELEPITWAVLTSHTVIHDGQLYDVQPGDLLIKLAKPFHVPPEFVMRINGLARAESIRPRQTLKFVEGPFDALIELSEFELTVLQKGRFVRRFPIGIGREDSPTPPGLFQVNEKQVNPIKWPDSFDRRKIAGGATDNPLGSRWIGIGLGYGIHGTIEPQTIGQRASRGCIRLRNSDVEQLYDMLCEDSRVLIR